MARVAAIDCGTNSIRLLVADVTPSDGTCATCTARCAWSGSARASTPPACSRPRRSSAPGSRSSTTRRSCAARASERVRMVATRPPGTPRTATTSSRMVRATLGVEAEVISGDEEAALSFAGAVGELDPADGPFVVVDVGGGSTELVVGDLTDAGASCARPARSTSAACGSPSGACPATRRPPSRSRRPAPSTAGILADAFAAVPVEGVRTWVGVAGTITTLSALAHGPARLRPDGSPPVPALAATTCTASRRSCSACPATERGRLGAMHPGRVDVIGGGALVVEVLARELHARAGITELVVSEHDILDGIARSRLADLPWQRLTVRRPRRARRARSSTAAPAPGSSPGGSRWRGRSAPPYRDEEYWGRPGARLRPAGRAAADRRASPRRRTAATAPGGCSPATAAATSSTPRCTPSAWPTSRRPCARGDGLALRGTRITAPVHCAPPDNKPTPDERDTCGRWLRRRAGPARTDPARGRRARRRSAGRRCCRCWPARAGRCRGPARGSGTARTWTWPGERGAAARCSAATTSASRTRSPAGSPRRCWRRCWAPRLMPPGCHYYKLTTPRTFRNGVADPFGARV